MKKTTLYIILSPVLLAGCAISPAISPKMELFKVNDKEACLALQNKRPHFAIVTDGRVCGGVKVIAHISVTYKGQISSSDNANSVSFKAFGNNISIGDQSYNLINGRFILVSTKDEPFNVRQFEVSEEDKINALTASDERMVTFFR